MNKRIFKISIVLSIVLVISFTIDSQASSNTNAMHRLYNPNSGEHFYTANVAEKNHLQSVGWNYEGVGWNAPTTGTPVYRLYNPNVGDHHYTLNSAEKDHLVSVGWNYEGISWYSATSNTIPVYRLYNPNAETATHHYTLNAAERDSLVALGWKDEGVCWQATEEASSTPSYSAPSCNHNWVQKGVRHVKEPDTVIEEKIPHTPTIYGNKCNDCSAFFTNEQGMEEAQHIFSTGHSGTHSAYIYGETTYEIVNRTYPGREYDDYSNAYYECSICGARQ